MTRSAWATLGIEATEDRSAIRRAYARQLKLTHPEDDPQGFQALRQAYETALNYADDPDFYDFLDGVEISAKPGWSGPDEGRALPDAAPADQLSPLPGQGDLTLDVNRPAGSGEADAERYVDDPLVHVLSHGHAPDGHPAVDHQRALGRLEAMLRGEVAADVGDLEAAFDEVIDAEAMQQLAIAVDTESRLASALAYTIPRSDPLIQRAVEAFGWAGQAKRWDMPYDIEQVVERSQDLAFLAELANPRHKLNPGYRLLTRPPSHGNWVQRLLESRRRKQVQQVLERIRAKRPGLLDDLDPQAVAEWDRRIVRGRSISLILTVVSIFIMLGLAVLRSGGASPDQKEANRLGNLTADVPGVPQNWISYCSLVAHKPVRSDNPARICDTAVEMSGNLPEALHARAFLRLRTGHFAEATSDYSLILFKAPDDAKALYGRGLAYFKSNWKSAALPDIKRATQINPKVADAFADLPYPLLSIRTRAPAAASASTGLPVHGGQAQPPRRIAVRWARAPSTADATRAYPPAALHAGLGGVVHVICKVHPDGSLGCRAASETPRDHDFGAAALKAMEPVRVATNGPDGRAMVGRSISIRLQFGTGPGPKVVSAGQPKAAAASRAGAAATSSEPVRLD